MLHSQEFKKVSSRYERQGNDVRAQHVLERVTEFVVVKWLYKICWNDEDHLDMTGDDMGTYEEFAGALKSEYGL